MMNKLTKAEEEIMKMVWEEVRCTVSQLLEKFPEPKPPHSSISSIVRILEKKGFVDHKAYGRTHEYFPIIAKEDYSATSISSMVSSYFGGNYQSLVSFLVAEEKLSAKDIEELMNQLKSSNHE